MRRIDAGHHKPNRSRIFLRGSKLNHDLKPSEEPFADCHGANVDPGTRSRNEELGSRSYSAPSWRRQKQRQQQRQAERPAGRYLTLTRLSLEGLRPPKLSRKNKGKPTRTKAIASPEACGGIPRAPTRQHHAHVAGQLEAAAGAGPARTHDAAEHYHARLQPGAPREGADASGARNN